MGEGAPASLAWAPLFVASANRALGGAIVAATLEPQADPLRWVLSLTGDSAWTPAVAKGLRMMLQTWAEANSAVYQKSEYRGRRFEALLYLRGLGPESTINPYEEKR